MYTIQGISLCWTVRGGVHISGENGRAYYKFRAVGPKGNAEIVVLAFKKRGIWAIDKQVAVVPHDGRVNSRLLLRGDNMDMLSS